MAHSKAPWSFKYDGDGDHAIFSAKGSLIATTSGDGWIGKTMDAANARLIAAAPEMYEALNELVETVCDSDIAHPLIDKVLERSRAAIRKAEGQ